MPLDSFDGLFAHIARVLAYFTRWPRLPGEPPPEPPHDDEGDGGDDPPYALA